MESPYDSVSQRWLHLSCKEELSYERRKHQGMSVRDTILRDATESSSIASPPAALFLSLNFFLAIFGILSFKCIILHILKLPLGLGAH